LEISGEMQCKELEDDDCASLKLHEKIVQTLELSQHETSNRLVESKGTKGRDVIRKA
jgi:hypothetical protein